MFLSTNKVIGAINGIIGDYLEKKNNPLSIPMTLLFNGERINDFNTLPKQKKYKFAIFIHGLSDSDERWFYKTESGENTGFGKNLHQHEGYLPLYIRYNSGLHISENGEKLHRLLNDFFSNNLDKTEEIVIIGHSMGGLITHSAIQHAKMLNENWESKLTKVFLLGSPHQGAPLEKGAHLVSGLLKAFPQPYLKLAADVLNLRSNGIKDLRYGYTHKDEWEGHNPDEILKNRKKPAEVYHDIEYYIIAGSIFSSGEQLLAQWLGDMMVPVSSALGISKNKLFHYHFRNENVQLIESVLHIQLPVHEQVLSFILKNIKS